jgi:hypothetical protein
MEQLSIRESGTEYNQDCNCAGCQEVVNGFDMEHVTSRPKGFRKRIARLKGRFYGTQYNPGLPTEISEEATVLQTLMMGTQNALIEVSKLIHQFNRTRQSRLNRMDGFSFLNPRMASDPTLISQEEVSHIKNLVRQGFKLCHSRLLVPPEDIRDHTAMLRNAFGMACSIKEMLQRVDRVLTLKGQVRRTVKTLNQMVSQPSCFSESIYLKGFWMIYNHKEVESSNSEGIAVDDYICPDRQIMGTSAPRMG